MTDVRPVIAVTSEPTRGLTVRNLAVTIAMALAMNLVVYGVGSAAGASWVVEGQTVTWILVVVATTLSLALGWGATTLVARRWARAWTVLAWVGLAFAVVSASAPLVTSDDATTGWSLAMMHVLTGIAWFAAVRPQRTSSTS